MQVFWSVKSPSASPAENGNVHPVPFLPQELTKIKTRNTSGKGAPIQETPQLGVSCCHRGNPHHCGCPLYKEHFRHRSSGSYCWWASAAGCSPLLDIILQAFKTFLSSDWMGSERVPPAHDGVSAIQPEWSRFPRHCSGTCAIRTSLRQVT